MENAKEKIKKRYRLGSERYDHLLSTQSFFAKLACRLVWGFSDSAYTEDLLAKLPDSFAGKILDVPVGTALFTSAKYARMQSAQITCVDYSPDMMAKAKKRFSNSNLINVICMQGDVGSLPFDDNNYDVVLTMNGIHAFPDKQVAWNELHRVLKPGGILLGCFYITGKNRRTDWFIRHLYVPKGYFTPPFESVDSLNVRLGGTYREVQLWTVGSIVCFSCKK